MYLGIGSNVGNRSVNVHRVIIELGKLGRVLNVSGLYETEPVGYDSDNNYINAVITVEVDMNMDVLLKKLKAIEVAFGRDLNQSDTYEDRIIDLDILLAGDLILESEDLVIPHPRMHERRFVLKPILDIDDPVHPVLNRSVSDILNALKDSHQVLRVE